MTAASARADCEARRRFHAAFEGASVKLRAAWVLRTLGLSEATALDEVAPELAPIDAAFNDISSAGQRYAIDVLVCKALRFDRRGGLLGGPSDSLWKGGVTLEDFLSECVCARPGARVQSEKLRAVYTHWAASRGFDLLSSRGLAYVLMRHGFSKVKSSEHFWLGLEIVDDPAPASADAERLRA